MASQCESEFRVFENLSTRDIFEGKRIVYTPAFKKKALRFCALNQISAHCLPQSPSEMLDFLHAVDWTTSDPKLVGVLVTKLLDFVKNNINEAKLFPGLSECAVAPGVRCGDWTATWKTFTLGWTRADTTFALGVKVGLIAEKYARDGNLDLLEDRKVELVRTWQSPKNLALITAETVANAHAGAKNPAAVSYARGVADMGLQPRHVPVADAQGSQQSTEYGSTGQQPPHANDGSAHDTGDMDYEPQHLSAANGQGPVAREHLINRPSPSNPISGGKSYHPANGYGPTSEERARARSHPFPGLLDDAGIRGDGSHRPANSRSGSVAPGQRTYPNPQTPTTLRAGSATATNQHVATPAHGHRSSRRDLDQMQRGVRFEEGQSGGSEYVGKGGHAATKKGAQVDSQQEGASNQAATAAAAHAAAMAGTIAELERRLEQNRREAEKDRAEIQVLRAFKAQAKQSIEQNLEPVRSVPYASPSATPIYHNEAYSHDQSYAYDQSHAYDQPELPSPTSDELVMSPQFLARMAKRHDATQTPEYRDRLYSHDHFYAHDRSDLPSPTSDELQFSPQFRARMAKRSDYELNSNVRHGIFRAQQVR